MAHQYGKKWRFTAQIDGDLYAAAKDYAEQHGASFSSLLEKGLNLYLEREGICETDSQKIERILTILEEEFCD